ncbi:MAG: DUF2505 family protein [Polyangiaceae bacterium]|nr:DUF2505 family protein [Polyangiaceae bacterium]
MTVTFRRSAVFDASPDRLLSAVTDPELLRKRVKPGTSAGTTVREVVREEARLVQELESEDYARTKTGGLDRSRTERSVTRYEWDLVARHCAWSWKGGFDWVRLTGTIDIRASGTGAELSSSFEIEAKIPLIGRMVERMMASEIEQDLPRYEALFAAELSRPRAE